MFNIKANTLTYNYRSRHIKGEINFIADTLSQNTSWLTGGAKSPEYVSYLEDVLIVKTVEEEDHALRFLISAQQLPWYNPAFKEYEDASLKDHNYT